MSTTLSQRAKEMSGRFRRDSEMGSGGNIRGDRDPSGLLSVQEVHQEGSAGTDRRDKRPRQESLQIRRGCEGHDQGDIVLNADQTPGGSKPSGGSDDKCRK